MRINEETIAAFNSAWTKYDKNATGMISVEDLNDFILDLSVEELKKLEENNSGEKNKNILFNFS